MLSHLPKIQVACALWPKLLAQMGITHHNKRDSR